MTSAAAPALEVFWIGEASPMHIASAQHEDLRIRERALVLHDWAGDDIVLVEREELFGHGPPRALVIRDSSRPMSVALAGEEGCELLRLDLEQPTWSHVAELPRFPNDVGGMCRLECLPRRDGALLHWELGVLALSQALELLWRHDLDWNHRLVHLGDKEVWFDLMYESDDVPQRIGERPWGYSVADGRELLDRTPPPPGQSAPEGGPG